MSLLVLSPRLDASGARAASSWDLMFTKSFLEFSLQVDKPSIRRTSVQMKGLLVFPFSVPPWTGLIDIVKLGAAGDAVLLAAINRSRNIAQLYSNTGYNGHLYSTRVYVMIT